MQTGDEVKFVKLTESQYNAIQIKDPGTIYFISDGFDVTENETEQGSSVD